MSIAFVSRVDATSPYGSAPTWEVRVTRGIHGALYESDVPAAVDVPVDVRAALIAWAIEPGDVPPDLNTARRQENPHG